MCGGSLATVWSDSGLWCAAVWIADLLNLGYNLKGRRSRASGRSKIGEVFKFLENTGIGPSALAAGTQGRDRGVTPLARVIDVQQMGPEQAGKWWFLKDITSSIYFPSSGSAFCKAWSFRIIYIRIH